MREAESGGSREAGAGRWRPGGTSLRGGRRRNNGTLPARSPRSGGASRRRGGQAPRQVRRPAPAGQPQPSPAGGPRLHLLSPTTALRPMGAIVLRDSSGTESPQATPADTATPQVSALCCPQPSAPQPRSGSTEARTRRGGATRTRVRLPTCRRARARAGGAGRGRGLVPAVPVTRAPPPIALRPGGSAPPAEMRLGARRFLAGAKAAPSPSPHAPRAPGQSRAPSAQGPKVSAAASAPGHGLLTSSVVRKPRYVLSFLFLGTLHFPPCPH